jgi:hypothetical protein
MNWNVAFEMVKLDMIETIKDMSEEDLYDWWWTEGTVDRDRWETMEFIADLGEMELFRKLKGLGIKRKEPHV